MQSWEGSAGPPPSYLQTRKLSCRKGDLPALQRGVALKAQSERVF